MTQEQVLNCNKAVQKLKEARELLDMAMYYMGNPMPDEEHAKIRAFYDAICKAMDLV